MKTKKCMTCLKEFEPKDKENFCSEDCEKKADAYSKRKGHKYKWYDWIVEIFITST